jgi:Protein of unknown function (DUF2510)
MTDTSGLTTPAGWYTDPAGSGHLRWWDGAAWTAHLAPQPTPEPAPTPAVPTPVNSTPVIPTPVGPTPVVQPSFVNTPVVQAPVFQATPPAESAAVQEAPYVPFQAAWNSTPQDAWGGAAGGDDFARPVQWNTPGGWLLAISGLLFAIAFVGALFAAGTTKSSSTEISVAVGIPLVFWILLFLFASADRRRLRSLGYQNTASIWWMFLAPPLVYLIVRTVVLWREVRHGIAPLITYLALSIASVVVVFIASAVLLPAFIVEHGGTASFTSSPTSSSEFAASLKTGLDEKGGDYVVTCPSTISQVIGSQFSCTAVDVATNISHTLTIKVVQGTDGKPSVKLVSVTPPISG